MLIKKGFITMSDKIKRILALVGVIVLVGMYLLTLILAFVDPTASKYWLKAAILTTLILPILLYAMVMLDRFLRK